MIASKLSEISLPRGVSVAETIVKEVARLAIEGKIALGQKLPPEGDLAETWGVARSSVREAFRVFQMLGVTEAKPGRGTILINTAPLFALTDWSQFTRAELIEDIVEARLVLEPMLAAMAARRADAAAIQAIQDTIDAGHRAIGKQAESIQTALDFHTAVAAAAGNQTLLLATRLLRSLYLESARNTRRKPENYHALLDDHERILKAIRERDPERAARESEKHMKHGLDLVLMRESGGAEACAC